MNTVVYCDFLWVHGKSWPPVWKEHELVREVERYQLETADFTSSQLGGSETSPLEWGWNLFQSWETVRQLKRWKKCSTVSVTAPMEPSMENLWFDGLRITSAFCR